MLLIHNLSEVATPEGSTARRGAEQGRVRRLRGAEVVCDDAGRIAFVGPPEDRLRRLGALPEAERLDGRGGTLIPGFVDPHTHLPWAGTREEEFVARLSGTTYQEIAAAGGGILSTVRSTRQAGEEELATLARRRMDRMLEWGTTTAEAKSGYGLSLEDELKQLRAIRHASENHPVDLVPTLLAAHEVPVEYRKERERYIEDVKTLLEREVYLGAPDDCVRTTLGRLGVELDDRDRDAPSTTLEDHLRSQLSNLRLGELDAADAPSWTIEARGPAPHPEIAPASIPTLVLRSAHRSSSAGTSACSSRRRPSTCCSRS